MSQVYRDGEGVLREQLDDRRRQRGALVEQQRRLDDELRLLDGEIRLLEARLEAPQPTKPRRFWPLAGAATAAVGAYATAITLYPPHCRKPKVDTAHIGAGVIRQAAELYMHMADDPRRCPTLDDLVVDMRIDRQKTSDPWGQPYRIECIGDDVHAWSAGKDGVHRSADDIADDFKPSDIKRVDDLD